MMLPTFSMEEIAKARCVLTHAWAAFSLSSRLRMRTHSLNELNHGGEQDLQF